MEQQKLIKNLSRLVQLDIDAVHAYEQAIERIDTPTVSDRLSSFRDDHQRHITDLSNAISQLGGEPPEFSKDFKGYFIEGFTALRSATGTEGALKAMKTNENLTNKTYDDALDWELPENIRQIIIRNRDDERRHLEYIQECLDREIWKSGREVA